jgi:hypothetical protein
MDSDKKAPQMMPQSPIQYTRTPNFSSAYANNAFIETSFWDLKLVFGENDQHVGPNAVVQHTAITLPWPQVKVIAYLLTSNIAAHEAQHGRIKIPSNVLAPVPDEYPKELLPQLPNIQAIHAALKANYDAFVAVNPEAASAVTATPKPRNEN